MNIEQLTFWDGPLKETKTLWLELYDLKEKQDNLRRGIFSRHDFMKKQICTLKAEIDELRKFVHTNKVIEYEDIHESFG